MIDQAEARHRAYSLLGRLFIHGLTTEVREIVAALPQLDEAVDSEEPEQWQVEHHRVLGREVFPYESVFRSDDGLMGGDVSGAVREAYERAGLSSGRSDVEPDHLGMELAHLAFLCAAERDALLDDTQAAVRRVRELQTSFLEEHVLCWSAMVLTAVSRVGSPFYAAVALLARQVLDDHAEALQARAAPPPVRDLVAVLAERNTRIRDVAELLILPSKTGWFIGDGTVGFLAREADVPEGFGPRAKKLEGVFFASVDHQRLPALLAALGTELEAWRGEAPDPRHAAVGDLIDELARGSLSMASGGSLSE